MTKRQLAKELRDSYDKAKRNEATLAVHLFGIKYAHIIREEGFTSKEIVEEAGMDKGYAAELSKGMKLSAYVKPVDE